MTTEAEHYTAFAEMIVEFTDEAEPIEGHPGAFMYRSQWVTAASFTVTDLSGGTWLLKFPTDDGNGPAVTAHGDPTNIERFGVIVGTTIHQVMPDNPKYETYRQSVAKMLSSPIRS